MTPILLRPTKLIAIALVIGFTGLAGSQALPGVGWRSTGATPDATAAPEALASPTFSHVWERTDKPVADGRANRTWMWGPQSFSGEVQEDYADAPGGKRAVLYFDKARMEINDPDGDPASPWFVTSGLLARELITGQMQMGDDQHEQREPARVNVAGDPDDPAAPTYATFAGHLSSPPHPEGSIITTRIDRAGNLIADPSLASHGAVAAHRVEVPGIDHQVASPFWAFMHSSGTIFQDGEFTTAPLFENPFYATGYPITEAYWTTVSVGGTPRDVLAQCFERRCLTYTPDNPDGWKVEAGNVGQHYYIWRHSPEPPAADVIYESTLLDWTVGAHPFGSTFTQDDAYHVRVTTADAAIDRTTPDHDFGDARASVEARLVSGDGDDAGCLVFRLNFDSFSYSLCVNADGKTYALYEGYAYQGQIITETLVDAVTLPGAGDPPGWATLSVAGRGDQLWFFVNDTLIGSATHAGSASGYVGVKVVSAGAGPVEFAFRNLVIRAVDQSLANAD